MTPIAQLELEKEEHILLCVDLYREILAGSYVESAFSSRIDGVQAALRGWQANANIRLAAVKMADILSNTLKLAKCPLGGRRWRRLRAKIEKDGAAVERLLAGVITDGKS